MGVAVRVPGPLRGYTAGKGEVEIEGMPGTVGEALAALWARYPAVRDRLVTEKGDVRPHVNIFVGRESIRYTGGLATPLQSGATISIIPAVSGG